MYPVRTILYVSGCLVASWTRSPVFHGVFAVVALAYQLLWLVRMNAFVFSSGGRRTPSGCPRTPS